MVFCDDSGRPCDHNEDDENCSKHCKNLVNISNKIIRDRNKANNTIEYNERYVLWTNRPEEFYCANPYNEHATHVAFDSIACVCNYSSVIHFMRIVGSSEVQKEACMALGLVHETVHTFGMADVYGSYGHAADSMYTCVMDYYVERDNYLDNDAVDFYIDVLNGEKELFCDSCKATLLNCIANTLAGWEE